MTRYVVNTPQVHWVMVLLWRHLTRKYLCCKEVTMLGNFLDILFSQEAIQRYLLRNMKSLQLRFVAPYCDIFIAYIPMLACIDAICMYTQQFFFSLSWGPGLKLFISFFVISNFRRSPLPVPPSFQVYTYVHILWAVAVSSSVHGSRHCILYII